MLAYISTHMPIFFLTGLYYGDLYTVEEQFLELLYHEEEKKSCGGGTRAMRGCFLMCGPAQDARKTAVTI